MNNSFSGNIEESIYAVLVMILMIPAIWIINRIFPWMVRKKLGK